MPADDLVADLSGDATPSDATLCELSGLGPEELAAVIRNHIPELTLSYAVDPVRQSIANSWPSSIDDSAAREEWDWTPSYDLEAMTVDMLTHLEKKLGSL